MNRIAALRMAGRLTAPFARGGDAMVLRLGVGTASGAPVEDYDFDEHLARFGGPLWPSYVLVARKDLRVDTAVTIEYHVGGTDQPGPRRLDCSFGAGTLSGTSAVLDLGPNAGRLARLTTLSVAPSSVGGLAAADWEIVALLGNISKLLWITGAGSDELYRHFERAQEQRHLETAVGRSLDWLGHDLGIPRFPPTPHSFDDDTVALYHLDDLAQAVPAVMDISARYRPSGHHGAIAGEAEPEAIGRLNRGFTFRGAAAEVIIPDHADFAFGAEGSFSFECLVKPEFGSAGEILSKHDDPVGAAARGWSLGIGDFGRGIAMNVRLLLGDGTAVNRIEVFLDETLGESRFSHLAGVVDRKSGRAILYLNGACRCQVELKQLGALDNGAPLRIGRAGTPAFRGVIDEVRISGIARDDFSPAIGEGDDSYRRRLRIFKRWTLPTRGGIETILNEVVGTIGGELRPLVLTEENAPIVGGGAEISIIPARVESGQGIDGLGRPASSEVQVNGMATDSHFDPADLVTSNDPRVIYDPQPSRVLSPGEQPPDAARMQLAAAQLLVGLVDRLEGHAGKLHVESAFDPRATDLRAVGRGLSLRHDDIPPGQLAALAHVSGFSFVMRPLAQPSVYVSLAPAELIGIDVTGGAGESGLADLRVGETVTLQAIPAMPGDVLYSWKVIRSGPGRAHFATRANSPTVTLKAAAAGLVTVKLEVLRRNRVLSVIRSLRIGLMALGDNSAIGANGAFGVTEAAAGAPDAFFHASFLVTHDSDRASYVSLDARRLHPAASKRLDRLLSLVGQFAADGRVQVTKAYEPQAGGLSAVGRTLTIRSASPAVLTTGQLGALAHDAGFAFVAASGTDLRLADFGGDLVTVSPVGDRTVEVGGQLPVTCAPTASPAALALTDTAVFVANSGTDTVTRVDRATHAVRNTMKVGWKPVALALNADKSRLFTADERSRTVTTVTLADGAIAATAVASGPKILMHHAVKPWLFIGSSDNKILRYDSGNMAPVRERTFDGRPIAMALTAADQLWVLLETAPHITVLAADTLAVVGTIALPGQPVGLAVAAGDTRIYVSIPSDQTIIVVDLPTKTVLDSVDAAGAPGMLAISDDGTRLYVTHALPGGGHLQVFERLAGEPHLKELGRLPVGRQPAAVIGTADEAYVADGAIDMLSRVALAPSLRVTRTLPLGTGLGEALSWVVHVEAGAEARIIGANEPNAILEAVKCGRVDVRALRSLPGPTPYSFEVRLNSSLANSDVTISKQQYDLIMNVLNALHPIGVEVVTRAVRERVVELKDGLLDASPDYTFPNFRVRGAGRPRLSRQTTR